MDAVHALVEGPAVQQAVRPVEPRVMQVVQRHHSYHQVQQLHPPMT